MFSLSRVMSNTQENSLDVSKSTDPLDVITGNDILRNASTGLAFQGILVDKNEGEILQQRFNLITVQGNISLTQPSHHEFDKVEEFKSEIKENFFKKGIEKFGASIKGSVEVSSLFKGLLNVSGAFSSNQDRQNIAENNQIIEQRYYSKVQYAIFPTAACILNPSHIRLDHNALQELKRIDNILRNIESDYT